ncbi:23S rRNA (pseudouridine(1915)-N(3))-methyltransferase RlmH [Candidatus Thiothrix sp. Deng01]|uniref:Ribosomal RNA large subunit methyltransferase H n=1 Tax=Candidatus Thiothrix phosphatis TaxID=3112415 RepID=A0ABU6CSM1_9GAMM|nr:23S rRNA (pseudouridine(1915)-N(3))-methyltransferase RlmH [Candidatus Thiothrix sp. Deng01]MEB4589373.1 23S rRNA (pseudouridine(1915)-N(3))-methyltransferase RlmH [Candidatus Thiothrix sp. Deng01]
MRIQLLAIGSKMPGWVNEGTQEYASRMPPHCPLLIREIAAEKRTKNSDLQRIRQLEGEKLLAAVPSGDLVVALDVRGRQWPTEELARQLDKWMMSGRDVSLLVGGPEGLSQGCLQRAEQSWSLSLLTFPHPLVRVIVSEQLFRAWSILANHPYHRGD